MSIAVKDSYVPWIGSIPSSWEMRKISRSFALIGGIHLVVLSACETAQGGPDKEKLCLP